jgi:hypothetical protein
MLVKVRKDYVLHLDRVPYNEGTLLDITEDEYMQHHYLLERVYPKTRDEEAYYQDLVANRKQGKLVVQDVVKVKVRTGYGYQDPIDKKKFYKEGEIIEIPEKVYVERHWIFELAEKAPVEQPLPPPSMIASEPIPEGERIDMSKVIIEPMVLEGKEEEEEKKVEDKDIAMDTRKHRAILRRPARPRKKL